jgi:membrane-bound lytic murein transglycosylase B
MSAAPRSTSARGRKRRAQTQTASARRWSQTVNETSDAMDIEPHVFRDGSATEIASALKRAAEASRRRKGTPFQSAMSMLNFYINRAGRNLPKTRRDTLQRAKRQLRVAFGRAP